MNQFFCGKSLADRGTMAHAKNLFNHRALKKKVMDNVSHVTDFLRFMTEGLICLLVMESKNMSSLDACPDDFKPDRAKKYLQELAEDIIDFWAENGLEHERCGEMIERIGLVNFLEGIGIDVDPNMVSSPRQCSYVRMDGWDEEAEKWFEKKREEKQAASA